MQAWLKGVVGSALAGRGNERGIACWQRGDYSSAEQAFRDALRHRPAYAAARSNLGMVLAAQGRMDEALAELQQAVAQDPGHAGAHINCAALLQQAGQVPQAVDHLREALRLDPQSQQAQANLVKPLMDLCDWPGVAVLVDRLKARVAGEPVAQWGDALPPFESLLLPFTPAFQLALARFHAGKLETGAARPPARPAADRPLNIGYLSADFHDHATAHLTLALYRAHDRGRFRVHAYSIGHSDDAYTRRIAADCDVFVDARRLSDAELVRRMRADGIDILVDMKGHTGGARPGVAALRPAPVQVNYLGYPGTSGAACIDYLVADAVVVPPGAEAHYSEAVVRLPDSYQATDDAQAIAPLQPRTAYGLPEAGFVFCCFNRLFKLEPVIFAAWMRILQAVPGSVLWLAAGHPLAEQRLRDAAARAGVEPSRLVFAGYLAKPDHLARQACADLFLDTHDVNAHTTATDALWAGVPLLTWPGAGFSTRVAASLLRAAGMAELVVDSLAGYEALAVRLAQEPQALAALRERLREPRRLPLFRSVDYVRHLEAAWLRMHAWALGARPGEKAAGFDL